MTEQKRADHDGMISVPYSVLLEIIERINRVNEDLRRVIERIDRVNEDLHPPSGGRTKT
jgi:hypothetical protein